MEGGLTRRGAVVWHPREEGQEAAECSRPSAGCSKPPFFRWVGWGVGGSSHG